MKRTVVILVIILFALVLFAGCGTSSIVGKYVSEVNKDSYIDLSEAGTYKARLYFQVGGGYMEIFESEGLPTLPAGSVYSDFDGTYKVEGSDVVCSGGGHQRWTIEGDTLRSPNGELFRKQ